MKNRLTFGDVAQALGCTTADVRAVVVEEKRLPAVYVTLIGAAQTYDYQLLKVDDEGLAFDLSIGGMEGSVHTGYLRVERSALEQFKKENEVADVPRQIGGEGEDKLLVTTERNILLTIIAALCKEAKLDYTKHAKTAGLIYGMVDDMDIRIGETTIEGHLKKIPEAVRARMK